MSSAHANVVYSNVWFVPSSNLELVLFRINNYNMDLSHGIFLISDRFEDYEWNILWRLWILNHLPFLSFKLKNIWIRRFTEFAFKRFISKSGCLTVILEGFRHQFSVEPRLEAIVMNVSNASLTSTWAKHWVFFCICITPTESTLKVFCVWINWIQSNQVIIFTTLIIFKMISFSCKLFHSEFHSTKLYDFTLLD